MLWINTLLEMNSLSFMTIFIVIIFLKTINTKWSIHKKHRPKLPPGPIGLPVIGCLISMILTRPTFRWIHKMMDEMNTEIACIRLGRVHVVSITSPELAREFLKKHDVTFASRPDCMSARVTSNGYLTAVLSPTGDQWKKMRRVLSSTILSPAMHHWLHDKRMMEADNLVRFIYNQCNNGGRVNVRVAAQQYCGNIVRRLIFNTRYFGQGKKDGGPGFEEEEHVEGLITILSYLYCFSISDYVSWLEIFDFDGYKGILKKAIGNVTKYHDLIIEHRNEMWRSGRKDNEEDILDVLINLKDSNGGSLLTIEEIKAQIIEIMLAAIDNPSNAVEWCLAEMLNQPEILRRASEELDQIVGNDRLVQESDLTKLNYIKACVKEAFRLHPVAPFNLPHVSAKDTNVGSYIIPKGSNVLLSRHGLGRNPRIWKEPSRYNPERHLNEDGSEVVLGNPELNMLSFSTGRRGCPAVLLGSTMATMLLARLIHGFTWNVTLDEPTIDLNESEDDLFLAKPLVVLAETRLCDYVYQQLDN